MGTKFNMLLAYNQAADQQSWEEMKQLFSKVFGMRSPIHMVDRIRRPLLIGQGANDPRARRQESDQIVDAMVYLGIPVTYVLYPDEGHGFAREENWLSFIAITEAFLADCLGGRAEPIGNAFEGSSLQVLAGLENVPGVAQALGETTGEDQR